MAKTLKIWNGRGWGRPRYDPKDIHQRLHVPYEEYCDHIFVCAHSKAEAVRIVNEVGGYVSVHEIDVYWSKNCWGKIMKGIEPELGVWGIQNYGDKPVRLYPKEIK